MLYYGFLIAFAAFSLFMRYKRHMKRPTHRTEHWQDTETLANELGLTFSEHSNEHYSGGWIHGTYQDVAINIQDEATFHNRGRSSYVSVATLYEAILDKEHIIDGLEVLPEGLLAKASKVFGAEDIQVGHEEIDKAFIIRANSELDAQRLFASPDVRNSFLTLQNMCSKFHLKDGILTIEYPEGIFQKHNKLLNRIDALVVCAQAIMNHKNSIPDQLPDSKQPVFTAPTEQEQFENTTVQW